VTLGWLGGVGGGVGGAEGRANRSSGDVRLQLEGTWVGMTEKCDTQTEKNLKRLFPMASESKSNAVPRLNAQQFL